MAGNSDSKTGQTLDELRYMQSVYQGQYEAISASINAVMQEMQALGSAQRTLENNGMLKDKDVLVGLGGGAYALGRISDNNSVLVSVGAGYLVEKDAESARGYVESLIKMHTEEFNRLASSRKQIENALMELSYRLEGA